MLDNENELRGKIARLESALEIERKIGVARVKLNAIRLEIETYSARK